jgi:hypothetical protein
LLPVLGLVCVSAVAGFREQWSLCAKLACPAYPDGTMRLFPRFRLISCAMAPER